MGNDENKKAKRRHIYDELNKSIDSFTSCDDYYSDDNTKKKRSNFKSKNKYRTKYKIQKHKKFSNDEQLNNKLVESSLILSDFLINNIINKDFQDYLTMKDFRLKIRENIVINYY